MRKQASQYDKIFRENIEAVIPSLMQNILGISAIDTEEIPDDVQHTKERKPDVLKKITDTAGSTFILQIEFQVGDELDMVYRMAEYYIMLERRYRLPIRQFVIFLGADQPAMPTQLASEQMQFRFPLIWFAQLDYGLFLQSNKPEEVILSILADFNGEDVTQVLRRILHRIDETTTSSFALQRHINQLRVLAQLRNLGINLSETMDSIEPYINEEKDFLYLRGLGKGGVQAKTQIVKNLLAKTTMTAEQVADIAGVSVEFVRQIQSGE